MKRNWNAMGWSLMLVILAIVLLTAIPGCPAPTPNTPPLTPTQQLQQTHDALLADLQLLELGYATIDALGVIPPGDEVKAVAADKLANAALVAMQAGINLGSATDVQSALADYKAALAQIRVIIQSGHTAAVKLKAAKAQPAK